MPEAHHLPAYPNRLTINRLPVLAERRPDWEEGCLLEFAAAICCEFGLEVVLGHLAPQRVTVYTEHFGGVRLIIPCL